MVDLLGLVLLEIASIYGHHMVSNHCNHRKNAERVGQCQESLMRDHDQSGSYEQYGQYITFETGEWPWTHNVMLLKESVRVESVTEPP